LLNSGGTSGPPDLQDPNQTLFYFMPSAALDKHGNLGLTFTSSGEHCSSCQTQPHPAVNFTMLPWQTTSFTPTTVIIQGSADEQNTTEWGEYASTVLDSTNGTTFYGVGEFFNQNENGKANCNLPASNCFTWKTRIFHHALN
jgi:hypothetical protein